MSSSQTSIAVLRIACRSWMRVSYLGLLPTFLFKVHERERNDDRQLQDQLQNTFRRIDVGLVQVCSHSNTTSSPGQM